MTAVQFVKEYTTLDGKHRRVGEVLILEDTLAAELVKEGIAKERVKPPGPTETKKAKAAPDQKTKAAEPEPEEGEEGEPF